MAAAAQAAAAEAAALRAGAAGGLGGEQLRGADAGHDAERIRDHRARDADADDFDGHGRAWDLGGHGRDAERDHWRDP